MEVGEDEDEDEDADDLLIVDLLIDFVLCDDLYVSVEFLFV